MSQHTQDFVIIAVASDCPEFGRFVFPKNQGSRMKGSGPMHRQAVENPTPVDHRFFRPMLEQGEPISAWD
jgi:hypothetical protein